MANHDDQVEETVEITSVLGTGAVFDGELSFEGTARIDGAFSGKIVSGGILVVGEGGSVRAEINAAEIIVEGYVEGDIKAARSVEIHTPGRVKGNIVTPSLFIDRGVIFEGSCRTIDPPDEAPAASAPPAEEGEGE